MHRFACDGKICNVNGLYLIWLIDDCVVKNIGVYFRLLSPLREIYHWVDRINVHFVYISSCFMVYDMITTLFNCADICLVPQGGFSVSR